jgi:hypothetical protein
MWLEHCNEELLTVSTFDYSWLLFIPSGSCLFLWLWIDKSPALEGKQRQLNAVDVCCFNINFRIILQATPRSSSGLLYILLRATRSSHLTLAARTEQNSALCTFPPCREFLTLSRKDFLSAVPELRNKGVSSTLACRACYCAVSSFKQSFQNT